MKVEFLADRSISQPLIRLFWFDIEEVSRLKSQIEMHSSGAANRVVLHEREGFDQVNGCRLYLCREKSDGSIYQTHRSICECVLSETAWDNMAGSVEPFCANNEPGYQWGTNSTAIRLLLSYERQLVRI